MPRAGASAHLTWNALHTCLLGGRKAIVCTMASSITPLRPPAAQEWVGGIVSMPTYVNDADAPFRPEILLWLNGDGLVIGTTLGKPGAGSMGR